MHRGYLKCTIRQKEYKHQIPSKFGVQTAINISAVGYGGGALCIVGAIFLDAIGNSSWFIFLIVGVMLILFGAIIRKM